MMPSTQNKHVYMNCVHKYGLMTEFKMTQFSFSIMAQIISFAQYVHILSSLREIESQSVVLSLT